MLSNWLNANEIIGSLRRKSLDVRVMANGDLKIIGEGNLGSDEISEIKSLKPFIRDIQSNIQRKQSIDTEKYLLEDFEGAFDVTPQQRQLLSLKNNYSHDYSYYIPLVLKFENIEQASQALDKLSTYIHHLPASKRCFRTDETRYKLRNDAAQRPKQTDYTCCRSDLESYIEKIIYRPFDLGESLIRFGRILTEENDCFVYFVCHHIIADGWSLGNMLAAIFTDSMSADQSHHLNYAVLKNDRTELLKDNQKKFWESYLEQSEISSNLPLQHSDQPVIESISSQKSLCIEGELYHNLIKNAHALGVSKYSMMAFILSTSIYYFTRKPDVHFVTTYANREDCLIESAFDFIVESFIVRNQVDIEKTVGMAIDEIAKNLSLVQEFADFPILEEYRKIVGGNTSNTDLDVMFSYQNFPYDLSLIGAELVPIKKQYSKVPISIEVFEGQNLIDIRFDFAVSRVNENHARQWVDYWQHCIEKLAAVDDPFDLRLVEILTTGKEPEIVGKRPSVEQRYIQEIIAESCSTYASDVAIVDHQNTLTYGDLSGLVRKFSPQLKPSGYIIFLSKSHRLHVAMLSVLDAGGHFVCIDPADSDETLSSKIRLASDFVVLTERSLSQRVRKCTSELVIYESLLDSSAAMATNWSRRPYARKIMYGVFSSGTTGNPKLSLNYHDSFLNLLRHFETLSPQNKDTFILGSPAFDTVLKNTFLPLLSGGKVFIYDYPIFDVQQVLNDIFHSDVSVLNSAYSLMSTLFDDTQAKQKLSKIEKIIIAGEVWSLDKIKKNHVLPETCEAINSYGPSETADIVLTGVCSAYSSLKAPPLKEALAGCSVSVVDDNLQPMPYHCKGQLLISGLCVGAGYTQSSLTKEKFIDFEEKPSYLSGDVAEITQDGEVIIHGRIDDQIKVNGIRIELAGLEVQIQRATHPYKIALRAFNSHTMGTYIVCYYLSANPSLDIDTIKVELTKSFSPELLPRYWVELDAFPLSINGKLNRKELPKPDLEPYRTVEPENIMGFIQNDLGIPITNESDDLLAHGADSIKMNRLKAQLEQLYGRQFTLGNMYDTPNLQAILAHHPAPLEQKLPSLDKTVLSASEKQFLFLEANQSSNRYHICGAFRFLKKFEPSQVKRALADLIKATETLRQQYDDASLRKQVIGLDEALWPQEWYESGKINFSDFCNHKEIQLNTGLPIRFLVTDSDCGQYVDELFIKVHHIAVDEYSLSLIIDKFVAILSGQETDFDALKAWPAETKAQLSNWIHLQEIMPINFQRGEYAATNVEYQLDTVYATKLKEVSCQFGVTEFSVMMSIFGYALNMVKGVGEFAVGTPISVRDTTELLDTAGCFINTLPAHIKIKEISDFSTLVLQTHRELAKLQQLKYTPLIDIKSCLKADHDLFNVMLVRHQSELMGSHEAKSLLEPTHQFSSPPRLDLTLHYTPSEKGVHLNYEYSHNINPGEIEVIHHAISMIFDEMILHASNKQLCDVRLPSSAYYKPMNQPVLDIVDCIVSHSKKTPNAIALHNYLGNQMVNYQELYFDMAAISSRYDAHFDSGVVAILDSNPMNVIRLMLGALYSGRGFVVLNPEDPAARRAKLVEQSGCVGVVSLNQYSDCIQITYDEDTVISDQPCAREDKTAYLIFTSGSTGEPKGAVIQYDTLCFSTTLRYHMYQQQMRRFLLLSPLTFDSAYAGLFGTLVSGGTLLLLNESERRSHQALINIMSNAAPTQTLMTPSLYRLMLDLPRFSHHLDSLILAGERLTQDLVDSHFARFERTQLFNEYGPTENTIWSSVYECMPHAQPQHVPIGKVLDGMKAVVMDEEMNAVPYGQKGQLYLAGAGLFKGYINSDAKESLVWLDLFDEPERFYATGDYVTMDPNGMLHFDSRSVEFIKIRGYRVSPSEIEHCVLGIDGVNDVKVLVENASLMAFVVSDSISATTAREHLKAHLPDYMVPHRIYITDSMPLNRNGKIDTGQLKEKYLAPEHINSEPLEPKFNQLVSNVLGNYDINPDRSFFENGGNSLQLMQLSAALDDEYQKQFPITQLYQQPTLRHIQQFIAQLSGESTIHVAHEVMQTRASRRSNKLTKRRM
ncbi:TPA: AMP-binding protein [Vibrio cholerae]|nr:AMP-binding protein [Vibrio cholerae]